MSARVGIELLLMLPLADVRTSSPRPLAVGLSFTRPWMAKNVKPPCAAARSSLSTLNVNVPSAPTDIPDGTGMSTPAICCAGDSKSDS